MLKPGSPRHALRPRWAGLRLLLIWILFLVVSGSALGGCASQPIVVTPAPETLRIVASDPCGPLMVELAAAYQDERPWVAVQVEQFNATVAAERLRSRGADMAAVSWLEEPMDSYWSIPFARDGMAIVAHPAVPIDDITLSELQEIFRGRVGEWSDGTPVQVVTREQGSALRARFEALVMGGYDVTLTALLVSDSAAVAEAVATTPGAIGYLPLTSVGGDLHALSVEGKDPALDRIGEYPLAFPLFLVTPAEPAGEVRIFVQWVLGPEGQERVLRRFAASP